MSNVGDAQSGSTATTKPAAKKKPTSKPAATSGGSYTSGGHGGYLDFAQLEALALHAGATRSEAIQLAAIAMAESSGRAGAHNYNPGTGDDSYGLWQINMLGAMGPERRQAFGIGSDDALLNPLVNARAALYMLRAQGWEAWSTYKSGAYAQFLPQAHSAIDRASNVNVQNLNYRAHAAGGGGGGAVGDPGNSSPRDYLGNVAADYGYLAAYLNDPEIGPILRKAAAGGWSEPRLLNALEKTHWWKTTSQTAREMQALQRTDPATYQEQLRERRQTVGALATSMGLRLGDNRLDAIAKTALWSNWTSQQLQEAVGAEFHYNPQANYTGSAGRTIQQFKAMSGDYLVPLDNHTLGQWTRQALEGKVNPDDFSGYLADQAKTLFPWMSKAIDKGTSPTQYLAPYVNAAAQTLELDPSAINLMQGKWRRLYETVDPKTGERTERGLANALDLMRTDPVYGFDHTQGAVSDAAAFADQIAQDFGYEGAA